MQRFAIQPRLVYSRTTGKPVGVNFYVKDLEEGRLLMGHGAFSSIDEILDYVENLERIWG